MMYAKLTDEQLQELRRFATRSERDDVAIIADNAAFRGQKLDHEAAAAQYSEHIEKLCLNGTVTRSVADCDCNECLAWKR